MDVSWILAIILTVVIFGLMIAKVKAPDKHRAEATELFTFTKVGQLGCGVIVVKKRGASFRNSFKIEAHHNYAYSVVPDKHILTSVTVGGVTTGGVSTVKGGIQPTDLGKTGYYWLCYKYAEKVGTQWWSAGIYSIVLPADLYSIAQNDNVLRQYAITKEQLKSQKLEYYKENSLIVDQMTSLDCNYLLNWLSNG